MLGTYFSARASPLLWRLNESISVSQHMQFAASCSERGGKDYPHGPERTQAGPRGNKGLHFPHDVRGGTRTNALPGYMSGSKVEHVEHKHK